MASGSWPTDDPWHAWPGSAGRTFPRRPPPPPLPARRPDPREADRVGAASGAAAHRRTVLVGRALLQAQRPTAARSPLLLAQRPTAGPLTAGPALLPAR